MFTADALHPQRACCAESVRFAGHCVRPMKKNQPRVGRTCISSSLMRKQMPECGKRSTPGTRGMSGWKHAVFARRACSPPVFECEWAGLGQAFPLRRRTTHPSTYSQQRVSDRTYLTPAQASPARLLSVLRIPGTSNIALIIVGMGLWAQMRLGFARLALLWLL